MFNLDPRTGMWAPKPSPRPAERVASPPRKMPEGLNAHGCWMFACYGPPREQRQSYVATLQGFRELLEREAGPDGVADAEGLRVMVGWAAEAKPGAVECYHNIHWLIAIDPAEDHASLLDGLDGPEWERWETLARAAGCYPW